MNSSCPITPITPGTIDSTTIPVITITPATLPSPPLTPVFHIDTTPSKSIAVPPLPRESPANPENQPHSLYDPLRHHLTFLHPQTPSEVIRFIADRLLSQDKPEGHEGLWTPLWALDGCRDLSTAGLGLEAGRGCRQKEDGIGKEIDRTVDVMYNVARRSWYRMHHEWREDAGMTKLG